MWLSLGGHRIPLRPHIEYLGLVLDGRWTFREHFRRITPKAERVSTALCRLLPNLGGPSDRVRRLYANVVHSLLLYGAPIWADELGRDKRSQRGLACVQKRVCLRVIRGYRTVAQVAAGVLAGVPPLALLASSRSRCYWEKRRRQEAGEAVSVGAIRREASASVRTSWRQSLRDERLPGRRTLEAIVPVFEEWMSERRGRLSFRTTQLLTGHGCFGAYLHRIGKEETPACWFCGADSDTVDHTLSECPRWGPQRDGLRTAVGPDLTLPSLVRSAVVDGRRWAAFQRFADEVLACKEAEERRRERDGSRPRRRNHPRRDRE